MLKKLAVFGLCSADPSESELLSASVMNVTRNTAVRGRFVRSFILLAGGRVSFHLIRIFVPENVCMRVV